ncbi:hypothetical protein ACJMQP_04075 [Rhodopseudomonas palustris]
MQQQQLTIPEWRSFDAHVDNVRADFVDYITKGTPAGDDLFAHASARVVASVQNSLLAGCYATAVLKSTALYMLVRKHRPGSPLLQRVVELARAVDYVSRVVMQCGPGMLMTKAESVVLTKSRSADSLFAMIRGIDTLGRAELDSIMDNVDRLDLEINELLVVEGERDADCN